MARRWAKRVREPAFDRFLVPAFLVAFALARAGRFEERDPYWQARSGIENLSGSPLIRPDTWSWVPVPGPWYQNSPLWNNLLGASYGAGGFWGLFTATAAVLVAYFGLVLLLALRLGARRLPGLAGILAAVSPALAMLSPRATLVVEVLMLLAVLVVVEWADRDDGRIPTAVFATSVGAVAAALSVLGNWFHLSFLLLGPALGGVWGLVWLLTPMRWTRRVAVIVAGGVGWLLGPLVSPYGVTLGLERSRIVQEVCAGLILEWTTPFSLDVSKAFWLMVAAASVAAAVVTGWLLWRARHRRWGRPETGVLALAVIGVPSAVAGWWAIRFLGIALLMLAPAIAVISTALVDDLRRRWAAGSSRWGEYTTGGFWRVILTLVMIVLAPGAGYLVSLHAEPAEAAVLRQLPAECRLFSSTAIAGASLLVRPDVTVWMDGRADYYGRARLVDAYRYFFGSNPTPVPPGTTCVVLDTTASDSKVLAAALESSPQWRRTSGSDGFAAWLPSP